METKGVRETSTEEINETRRASEGSEWGRCEGIKGLKESVDSWTDPSLWLSTVDCHSTSQNKKKKRSRTSGQLTAVQGLQLLSQSGRLSHCHSRSGYDYWWWGADKKDSLYPRARSPPTTKKCRCDEMGDECLFNTLKHRYTHTYAVSSSQRQKLKKRNNCQSLKEKERHHHLDLQMESMACNK